MPVPDGLAGELTQISLTGPGPAPSDYADADLRGSGCRQHFDGAVGPHHPITPSPSIRAGIDASRRYAPAIGENVGAHWLEEGDAADDAVVRRRRDHPAACSGAKNCESPGLSRKKRMWLAVIVSRDSHTMPENSATSSCGPTLRLPTYRRCTPPLTKSPKRQE